MSDPVLDYPGVTSTSSLTEQSETTKPPSLTPDSVEERAVIFLLNRTGFENAASENENGALLYHRSKKWIGGVQQLVLQHHGLETDVREFGSLAQIFSARPKGGKSSKWVLYSIVTHGAAVGNAFNAIAFGEESFTSNEILDYVNSHKPEVKQFQSYVDTRAKGYLFACAIAKTPEIAIGIRQHIFAAKGEVHAPAIYISWDENNQLGEMLEPDNPDSPLSETQPGAPGWKIYQAIPDQFIAR